MHQAILSVAYGAGLRASEIAKLRVSDVDGERMLLRVACGKGGGHRNAVLPKDLLYLLRAWWKEGRDQGVMHRDGWLFPGQHYLKPICYRQVHRIAAEAARAAGITKRVGPHTLRHSFATHLLEDGIEPFSIRCSSPATASPRCAKRSRSSTLSSCAMWSQTTAWTRASS